MPRIVLVARSGNSWAATLLATLRQLERNHEWSFAASEGLERVAPEDPDQGESEAAHVYAPSLTDRDGMRPDLAEAERVLQWSSAIGPGKFILLSSALIYGTGPARQSLVSEDYVGAGLDKDEIRSRWKSLEALAGSYFNGRVPLTILRPTTVVPSAALLSRRLMRMVAVSLPGHDPLLQLLSLPDLAKAVLAAIDHEPPGGFAIFNVAPDGVVPLHAVLRLAGKRRLPVPRALQRLARRAETLEYLRYPWTVSNNKIKAELGFVAGKSSVVSLREATKPGHPAVAEPAFDPFGMDRNYIEFYGKTLFKFLSRVYWRIETKGLEYIPREGPAVLVGTHRGFMPWDAVMTLHLLREQTGRIPRFLSHPGLLKFPFIANFVTRLGGAVACQESADRLLEKGELLGIYPEGVRGAFALYRQAYTVGSFGRDDFVKIALRHRVPITPFVNVGSAEALPLFAQLKWRWWMRYSDWPCLPLATFPFVPVPLPSKWHIQFLPPLHVEQRYPPEAAHDPGVVREISQTVRARMQQAMDFTMACASFRPFEEAAPRVLKFTRK